MILLEATHFDTSALGLVEVRTGHVKPIAIAPRMSEGPRMEELILYEMSNKNGFNQTSWVS